MQDFSNLDGYYTQSFDGRNTSYHAIYENTLTTYDSKLLNIWTKAYNAISRIRMLDYILEKGGVVEASSFMAYIHQLAAVQYFQLASWWENVPYVLNYNDPLGGSQQLGSENLCENFIDDVNYGVEQDVYKRQSMHFAL